MAQRRSGEVGPVLFYHASTRRIFESAIGFKAVVGVWEVSDKYLGLVEIRLDDLVENPAWRQQTGSSIPDRCLMVLRIERTSGGRRRPEKHVGNIGNHSGKLLPVWVRHLGNRLWTTGWYRNSRPYRNRSTNNADMAQCRLGEVGPVLFYHASTRRIIWSFICFDKIVEGHEPVTANSTFRKSASKQRRKSTLTVED